MLLRGGDREERREAAGLLYRDLDAGFGGEAIKLLHSSDWHLRDRDHEECEKVLSFLVGTARAEAVDLIVLAGDCFDSQDVKLDSQAAKLAVKTVSVLADICPVAIITGTSSHEGTATEILSYVRGKNCVHVATKPEQIEMAGAVLTLIPQPTKQFWQGNGGIQESEREIGAVMSALFAGFGAQAAGKEPHVLVGHWNVSGAKLSTGQILTGQDIEVSLDQMMLANPDLVCLGHIHAQQQLGDRTFYAGSVYRTNWAELEPKGFLIHDFNCLRVENPNIPQTRFIDTPCKKVWRVQEDFTNNGGVTELDAVPYGVPEEDSCVGAYVRCDFRVYQDEAGKLDREKIRAFYLSAGAVEVDVRIIRVPREQVRAESVLKVERLRDKLAAMATLKDEEIPLSVLEKADALEDSQAEELLAGISGNGRKEAV